MSAKKVQHVKMIRILCILKTLRCMCMQMQKSSTFQQNFVQIKNIKRHVHAWMQKKFNVSKWSEFCARKKHWSAHAHANAKEFNMSKWSEFHALLLLSHYNNKGGGWKSSPLLIVWRDRGELFWNDSSQVYQSLIQQAKKKKRCEKKAMIF